MKTHATCPVCQARLSLWTGLKAPSPVHLRCPKCKERLRVVMNRLWLFYLLFTLFGAGGVAGMIAAHRSHGSHGLTIAIVSFVAVAAVLEFVAGIIFYTHGQIVRAKEQKPSGN